MSAGTQIIFRIFFKIIGNEIECQRMSAGTQIIFRIFFKIIGNEIECQRMSAGTQIGTHAPLGR